MIKTCLVTALILSTNVVLAEAWKHGTVDIVESYSDKIFIRWSGPKTENCTSNSTAVVVTAASLGSQEALDRAFKLSLTAAVSGKPIRFRLDGCVGTRQRATVVQLCAKPDCAYQ